MSSGIEWDDETYYYNDPRNDVYQLFTVSDPIRYILSKDIIETPETVFAYRNCNTNLLGEIIHRVSGQRIDVFAENYLFSKLGINELEWQMLHNNVVFCSGDLRLRPRDMAKFGQLFLMEVSGTRNRSFLQTGLMNLHKLFSQHHPDGGKTDMVTSGGPKLFIPIQSLTNLTLHRDGAGNAYLFFLKII